jgi:hypothetical protein
VEVDCRVTSSAKTRFALLPGNDDLEDQFRTVMQEISVCRSARQTASA